MHPIIRSALQGAVLAWSSASSAGSIIAYSLTYPDGSTVSRYVDKTLQGYDPIYDVEIQADRQIIFIAAELPSTKINFDVPAAMEFRFPWDTGFQAGHYEGVFNLDYRAGVGMLTYVPEIPALTAKWGASEFDVLDLAFGADGQVLRFAADYKLDWLYSSGAVATVTGSVRFQSDIPVTSVPEPDTLALMGLGFAGVCWTARRQRSRAVNPT